jgi:hypothetical protein
MRLRSMLPLLAAPLAGCAGTATTEAAGDRAAAARETDCVWTRQITDWDALDDRNLIVYEGRRPYKVELARTCVGLDFATLIGFYDRGGDARICGFGMDRVVVDRLIPEGCSITAVDELTDEQAADLKVRAEQQKALARPKSRR